MPAAPFVTAAQPGWLRKYWIVLALLALIAATLPPSFHQPALADWLHTYVTAAQRLWAHEPLHNIGPLPPGVGRFTYLPAGAIYALPVAFAPPMVALLAWYVASLAAICAGVVSAWRLAGGPRFGAMTSSWWATFALATLLVLRFVISAFGNRQTDLLIAGATLTGCWFVASRRELRGAILLGLAASIKGPPLLFAPYLAWRGRWRAAAVVIAAALVVNLLPDLLWPRGPAQSYLGDWRYCLAAVRDGGPGVWFADALRNQSVAGVLGRYAAVGLVTSPEEFDATAASQMSPLRQRMVKLGIYGTELLLVAGTAFAFRRRGEATGNVAAELGAVICLMLLLSPMTAKAHMCVLVLPVLLIARAIVEQRTTGWLALGALLALCGPLAATDLLGRNMSQLTLAWGVPGLFTLLCLVGMWKLALTPASQISR